MKEYTYAIEKFYNNGKAYISHEKVEKNNNLDFFSRILEERKDNNTCLYIVTLKYIKDQATGEHEKMFLELINDLELESTRRYFLHQLHGKKINKYITCEILQYWSNELMDIIYKKCHNYDLILDSNNIYSIGNINIEKAEIVDSKLICYNKDRERVCSFDIKKIQYNEF